MSAFETFDRHVDMFRFKGMWLTHRVSAAREATLPPALSTLIFSCSHLHGDGGCLTLFCVTDEM